MSRDVPANGCDAARGGFSVMSNPYAEHEREYYVWLQLFYATMGVRARDKNQRDLARKYDHLAEVYRRRADGEAS